MLWFYYDLNTIKWLVTIRLVFCVTFDVGSKEAAVMAETCPPHPHVSQVTLFLGVPESILIVFET